ncbi:RNA recognition motif domain-containing protein [Thiocystis violacea]|uniref:RNA recognition motif domain-containing protein n=1 Tax=Thiocystis violacea TaxID=13725 RepID=UPI001908D04A|nr:RNA-binding protein [Thiocystis violacea]MBK1721827.1 hypothetical protein [Thiocystis violacea]
MTSLDSTTKDAIATIRVTHLPDQTSEAELEELFSGYGAVHRVSLISGEPECRFQKVGYVDLVDAAVEPALSALDGHLLNGSIIHLSQVSGHPPSARPAPERAPRPAGDDQTPSNSLRRTYEVLSVEPAVMPASTQKGEWFRYVLTSGRANIVGYHRGTLEEVTAFAEACAEDFNLRNSVGWKASAGRARTAQAAAAKAATPKTAKTSWT